MSMSQGMCKQVFERNHRVALVVLSPLYNTSCKNGFHRPLVESLTHLKYCKNTKTASNTKEEGKNVYRECCRVCSNTNRLF